MERNPKDRRPALGLAQQKLDLHDFDAVESILQDILQSHPDFAPAYAMLGMELSEKGDFKALANGMKLRLPLPINSVTIG